MAVDQTLFSQIDKIAYLQDDIDETFNQGDEMIAKLKRKKMPLGGAGMFWAAKTNMNRRGGPFTVGGKVQSGGQGGFAQWNAEPIPEFFPVEIDMVIVERSKNQQASFIDLYVDAISERLIGAKYIKNRDFVLGGVDGTVVAQCSAANSGVTINVKNSDTNTTGTTPGLASYSGWSGTRHIHVGDQLMFIDSGSSYVNIAPANTVTIYTVVSVDYENNQFDVDYAPTGGNSLEEGDLITPVNNNAAADTGVEIGLAGYQLHASTSNPNSDVLSRMSGNYQGQDRTSSAFEFTQGVDLTPDEVGGDGTDAQAPTPRWTRLLRKTAAARESMNKRQPDELRMHSGVLETFGNLSQQGRVHLNLPDDQGYSEDNFKDASGKSPMVVDDFMPNNMIFGPVYVGLKYGYVTPLHWYTEVDGHKLARISEYLSANGGMWCDGENISDAHKYTQSKLNGVEMYLQGKRS